MSPRPVLKYGVSGDLPAGFSCRCHANPFQLFTLIRRQPLLAAKADQFAVARGDEEAAVGGGHAVPDGGRQVPLGQRLAVGGRKGEKAALKSLAPSTHHQS